jgi:hypothetical protein
MDDELLAVKRMQHKMGTIETRIQLLEHDLASWKEYAETRREEVIKKRKELERFKSLSHIASHLYKYQGTTIE